MGTRTGCSVGWVVCEAEDSGASKACPGKSRLAFGDEFVDIGGTRGESPGGVNSGALGFSGPVEGKGLKRSSLIKSISVRHDYSMDTFISWCLP